MRLPELHRGTLVRRYKRFLADVESAAGERLTIHCPNTGAMTGCAEPGSAVWYSISHNAKRKYPHTWELVDTPAGIASVNTTRANALGAEAIGLGRIADLPGAAELRREVAMPEGGGRFDLQVVAADRVTWVEIKSVTLHLGAGVGAFPDAKSARALKHVEALRRRVVAGDRAVLLFCAQHCGIEHVRPAHEVDPLYAEALDAAIADGVEVMAYGCATDLDNLWIDRRLSFSLNG